MWRKNVIIIIVVFVVAMLCYYLLLQKANDTNPTTQIPTYIEQATSGLWQTYKPDSGRFSASFPTIPKHASTRAQSINYEVYNSVGSDGMQYTLSIAQYPASADLSNAPTVVQNVLDKIVAGPPKNTLIGEVPLTVQGYTAYDFNLQNSQLATMGRIILAGNTLYVLMVQNPSRTNLDKNFKTFTDSLQIK